MPRYFDAEKIDFKLGIPLEDANGELYIAIRDVRKAIAQASVDIVIPKGAPIKNFEIIVRENCDFPLPGIEKTSTVGWKVDLGDAQYGDYIRIRKPSLEASDIVEACNELLEQAVMLMYRVVAERVTKDIFADIEKFKHCVFKPIYVIRQGELDEIRKKYIKE